MTVKSINFAGYIQIHGGLAASQRWVRNVLDLGSNQKIELHGESPNQKVILEPYNQSGEWYM